MKSITRQKSMEEIEALLTDVGRVFVIGCGTCATMCRTGGVDEVAAIGERLKEAGKLVTGSVVPPTTCDGLTPDALEIHRQAIDDAQALLVMACAFGVQNCATAFSKRVAPGLDTLFFGMETSPGFFQEVCDQCGQCLLGDTAGICPLTACHKGLLNGPCGGTNNGKCEIDKNIDCAWTKIHERLEALGQLDLLKKYHEPRNFQVISRPGQLTVEE